MVFWILCFVNWRGITIFTVTFLRYDRTAFSCQTPLLWSMSDCDDDLFSFCLLKSILYRLRTHHLYMLNVVMILLIPINSYYYTYYYYYYSDGSIPMKKDQKTSTIFLTLKTPEAQVHWYWLINCTIRCLSWQYDDVQ